MPTISPSAGWPRIHPHALGFLPGSGLFYPTLLLRPARVDAPSGDILQILARRHVVVANCKRGQSAAKGAEFRYQFAGRFPFGAVSSL